MAYTIPSAADLKAMYPEFGTVADTTVSAYLTRAATQGVDTSWPEVEYAPALTDYAAHNMAMNGLGAQDEVTKYQRAGVTAIRSGSFNASFSDQGVARATAGNLDATSYGRSYKLALRRAKGGARVVAARSPGNDGCGDWTGSRPWGC